MPGQDAAQVGRRGLFVTLEGGEGAGKSTQLEALARLAQAGGHEVVTCREPGGTVLGERLREALFAAGEGAHAPSAAAELLVFNAARAQLVHEVIRPALERGALVICDRFADSTTAYQQHGRGLDATEVEAVNRAATGGLRPDVTVLLDLDPKEGLARAAERRPERPGVNGDYLERADIAFHARVRRGFLQLAAADPDRWLVLDASAPAQQITHVAWERIREALKARA